MSQSPTPPNPGLDQPLSLSRLLDEAIRRARRHFRRIYLPVAIPLCLASVIPNVAQIYFVNPAAGMRGGEFALGFALFLAGTVLTLLIYGIGYGALMVCATDAVMENAVDMGRAWRTVVRPRSLGTLILMWLAVLGGTLLCILPGVYLGLLFGLVLPIIAAEDLAGSRALGRSRDLMRYNPVGGLGNDPRVKLFLIGLASGLLGYVASLVVQLPFIIVQQVLMFRQMTSGSRADPSAVMASVLWLAVPQGMLGMLVQVAVQLYAAFGTALLYLDVRRRKEGFDLEAAIQSLGAP